jgi:transglutaminase-like putative cysteine protease/tetratricopeptide (TPR) repeat protein
MQARVGAQPKAAAAPGKQEAMAAKSHAKAAWAPLAPFAVPAAEIRALPLPRSPKEEDAEILFQSVRVNIEKDATVSRQLHQIIRVITQQGLEDWSDVRMTFDPWYENRPVIKARVVTPDGRENWLDPQTITEEASKADEAYSTRRRVRAPLPAVTAGAVIEVLYQQSQHKPFFAAGTRGREYLYAPTYTQTMRLTFDVDIRVPFQYQARGTTLKPQVVTSAGRKLITFELQDELPFAKWPSATPPDVAPVPVVEYGFASSWRDVADAYSQEVDRQLAGFDAVSIAQATVATAPDPREKAAKLLAFVHANVRYVALELGERSILPAPPAQVLKQRFGDCKDKSALLVALLRAAGIPASVALLETGPGLDTSAALPGFGTFDHAIVHVDGEHGFWIDPSIKYTEVGVLPVDDQNRDALIANRATTGLLRTPAAQPESNVYEETFEFSYPELGPATVTETTVATGAHAANLRSQFDNSLDQLKQNLSRYTQEAYSADVTSVESFMSGPTPKLVIQTGPSTRLKTGDDGISLKVSPRPLFSNFPSVLTKARLSAEETAQEEKLDPRTKKVPALALGLTPEKRSATYVIKAPSGFVWEQLPDDIDTKSGPLHMQRRSTREGDDVRVAYTVTTGQPVLSADRISAVHEAVLGFLDTASVVAQAVYKPTRAVTDGDYAASVKLHRETIAGGQAGPHAVRRFAMDLLRMGLVLPARRMAKAALETDPKSAWAHYLLGTLAYGDDLGRPLRPGAQVKEARKAYARAVELAPDETALRAQYARSLLVGLDRSAFGKTAELTRSREMFMALRKKENSDAYDLTIFNALFFGRQFKETIAFAQSLKQTTQAMRTMWLAAVALVEGLDAFERKASQFGADADSLMGTASGNLLLIGEYALAVKIASLPRLAQQKTARELEELAALANPGACRAKLHPAVQAILMLETPVMLGQETPERAVERLVQQSKGSYVGEYRLRWHFRDLVIANGTEAFRSPLNIALRTCAGKWSVDEANDAVRVRRFAPGSEKATSIYLLRKHGGSYHLQAVLQGAISDLGELIKEDLVAHHLDSAERWAEWLHDQVKDAGGKRDEYLFIDGANDVWLSPHHASDREHALWLMAATVIACTDTSKVMIDMLQETRRAFSDDPRLVLAADAMTACWTRWNRPKDSVGLFEALRRGLPHDRNLRYDFIWALERSREYDRALREQRDFAAYDADRATDGLLSMEAAAGQWSEAHQQVQARLKQGKATVDELNTVAWAALFQSVDLGAAVRLAEEGVRMSKRRSFAVMHTLAVLYAEQGRFALALSTIKEALALEREYPVPSDAWYVFGRVAEALGFPEDARRYYERCNETERAYLDPIPIDERRDHSTWQLAQRRLAATIAP